MVRLSYDDDVAAYEALADAVLPEAGDNCAIARRLLKAGTKIDLGGEVRVTLSRDVREGFRFATRLVTAGEELTSWGLGFGAALVDIKAGALLMNRGTLDSLACRTGLDLPEANFKDLLRAVDETEFGRPRRRAARKDVRDGEPETFQGYLRPGARGVGTRNWIVVVPTTAAAAPWADALARKFDGVTTPANVDGVASLAHTEGSGGSGETAHDDRLDRTLAGLVAHPNVFAALVVQERNDGGGAVILEAARTAFRGVPGLTEIVTLEAAHDLEALLEDTFTMLRDSWLPAAAAAKRTACPLSELKVALQCGGSDAFSGVSGNPTVGWCAKEVVKLGGTALLAETDELMGAEAYVLERASPAVQRRFLALVRRYRGYLAAHGQTAEANPSGGNKLRGLYNIALKSLGAAKKKHRETPLDCVIEYAEALKGGNRGYVFMDSPGNDLESVAGQVAAGCNVVHFVTGNGSVTNFPFVPTIKVVTTTARYDMLQNDMDLNAGRYQEGTPISVLGAELFQLSLSVAGGDRTKGERAGHSQLSIWRAPSQMEFDADSLTALAAAHGQPLAVRAAEAPGAAKQRRLDWFVPTRPVALVLPTSVCSSQVCAKIASGIAAGLSAAPAAGPVQGPGEAEAFRVAAVPHTEGCGCGHAGDGELLFVRVVVGHLLHPNVVAAAVVEHGCEKTHNEWVKQRLRLDQQAQCGWFSIQLGGGNDKTIADV
ncbi:Altronate hydrolase, partial [Pelagophyceae sp. CCMP2097]